MAAARSPPAQIASEDGRFTARSVPVIARAGLRRRRVLDPRAVDPDVDVAAELPAPRRPHHAGTRALPVARDPLPVAVAPVPAAGDPDVAGAHARRLGADRRRRRG